MARVRHPNINTETQIPLELCITISKPIIDNRFKMELMNVRPWSYHESFMIYLFMLIIESSHSKHSLVLTMRQCRWCRLAVNTRTSLGIVPPQDCEAILIEILQPGRSAAGPHFICLFLMSKERYNRSKYNIGILILILLGRASFM